MSARAAFDPAGEQVRQFADPFPPALIDHFWRLGVPADHLTREHPVWGLDFLLCARVVFRPRARFRFASEDGDDGPGIDGAFTFPARRGIDGEIEDVVAWHPGKGLLATWLGRVSMLGEDELEAWEGPGEPLAVHRSPLGYLRAGWRGVVVIHEAPARRALLECGRPLLAEDLAHGDRLEAMLARALPRILVPDPDLASAGAAA